ncbi:MAG: hypothetical protein AB7U75_14855 [Hyphomicrobiaceae bacterium]
MSYTATETVHRRNAKEILSTADRRAKELDSLAALALDPLQGEMLRAKAANERKKVYAARRVLGLR